MRDSRLLPIAVELPNGLERSVLVLGEADGLTQALQLGLAQHGIAAVYQASDDDAATSAALERREWRAVVVVTRDDVLALRLSRS